MVQCTFIDDTTKVKCTTKATYGLIKNRPLNCKKHKLENYTDVANKMCEKCNVKQCTYGFEKKNAKWCFTCKEDGSVDVKHVMCEFKDCLTRPTFGVDKARRCVLHKKDEDKPFWYKSCEIKNCKLVPSFAENENGAAIRCSKHKLEKWVDISHKSARCKFDGCTLQATFGVTVIEFCSKHKSEKDKDLKHPTCIFENCNIQATFGEKDGKRLYCTLHKNDDNISLNNMVHGDLYSIFYNVLYSVKHKDKRSNRNFDLTIEYIFYLYDKQKQACYYCNTKLNALITNKKTFDQVSIDRKKTKIGHIKGNCVLSCLFCNLSKSDSSISDYKLFLESIKNPELSIDCLEEPTNWISPLMYRINNKNKDSDITKEWIKQQFEKQNGRCSYTNIKMINSNKKRHLFQPSMERMDCSKSYTIDNCVLVCLGSNLGRNDVPLDEYKKYVEHLKKK